MIAFAPAKINLGLSVLGKREDGFHELDSYMYAIPLYDIIEIQESQHDKLTQTGQAATEYMQDNLVYKVLQKLRADYDIPSLNIHLHKQIPAQAGLGGGSSDAVAMLKMLNNSFDLKINTAKMWKLAMELGSDCPFFLQAQPTRIGGRGEHIQAYPFSLKDKYMVIVKPPINISTAEAFKKVQPYPKNLPDIDKLPINKWKGHLFNDFEKPLFALYPELATIKAKLYSAAALYASLSGSGSAIFGIFDHPPQLSFKVNYFVWQQKLRY